MLGRLTSETNPETANLAYTYTYDSDATCGTSAGDLVKRVDTKNNVTCYAYDALHRVTSVTYPSGPNSGSTARKYFVYDAASLNSQTMANAKSRLAEAYTCTTCPGTKITDLGFSYTKRGEVSDVYESTPHSAGYYHLNATYFAHGALNAVGGLTGLPTIYYGGNNDPAGLDGEGRYKKVTASSGTNPTTGVTYTNSGTAQPLGSLTKVTLGSADNDTFSYDRNTGRLTQYNFNIGATPQTVQGNLTWNANGTLAKLAITDPFNSADAQTCTFGYDDLARVKSANCGTSWSQTFSLDPFGNLSKSGTVTFQPGFDQTKNWFLPTTGFDNNGNLLRDATHTYNWDAENKLTAIDTVSLTFDALGRMVEQARGSSYTQIVYSPAGSKLALMSGQALQKAFCPLPGGATAVYNSSGVIAYYRHADWLGSSRFASTPSRTKYFDVAYAPYGEDYADSGTVDLNFTGQNQDTVSGLYDFLYREYHANSGRWISPDPVGLGAVDFSNPQTWNRYAYVGNNPLNASDPLGLWRSDAFSSGLDGSCSINGFISACAMVMSFASAGGGGEFGAWCPDNQCVFNANGLVHFNSVNDMYDYNWAHLSVGPDGTVIDTSGPTDDQSKSVVEGAQGTNQPPTPPLECNSGFIQASSDAWKRAGIGSARTEAGFFVLGSVQNPSFKNFPFTNESGTVTGLAVPLGAIATVHTHPNALGAPPSPGDISNSDRVNLPFYVLSNRGLYVHNPGLKGSTLLRSRLSWLTPCK